MFEALFPNYFINIDFGFSLCDSISLEALKNIFRSRFSRQKISISSISIQGQVNRAGNGNWKFCQDKIFTDFQDLGTPRPLLRVQLTKPQQQVDAP